jgi:Glyoxalase-like domain
MSKMRLAISLDCADPIPLSTFWASLLDGEILRAAEDVAIVKVDPGLLLVAMRVEEYVPPTWPEGSVPKQAHIDVEVDDLNRAAKRAVSLGAVQAESQRSPDRYLVLLDPAGHPFCLSTAFPAE